MTLLILGGTGTLGRQIVKKALENGFPVRCIVRNKKTANFLKEWGAELIYGDLSLPETLPLSFQGITAIIDASTSKSQDDNNLWDVDWYGKLILIELAKYIKIKRFIFMSILNAEKYPYITLMQMKSNIEKILKNSGIPFTIFKCGGFFSGINKSICNSYFRTKIYINNKRIKKKFLILIHKTPLSFVLKVYGFKKQKIKVFFLGSMQTWKSEEIINLCEKLSGQKAKIEVISIIFLKLMRQITGFFEWTLKVSDRLAFIEVLIDKQNFTSSIYSSYKILKINTNEILELDFYLQEYFEMMLITLENLNVGKILNKKNLIL
uniref:hypothetical protein n=1 Tax=Choristocarpus tenellus TaxID=116065 RepID=UPI002E7623C6|nr:hypothetical protein V2478_pgp125 [Choristocarpus tenellus]WAM62290.1 hypothetical protein [Choristocarpus tenellus]